MGCDIHMIVSVKDAFDDEWRSAMLYEKINDKFYYCSPYNYRNYQLFGLLTHGNVRCDVHGPSLPSPRGIDMHYLSDEAIKEYGDWIDCSHSETHFTLDELKSLEEDLDRCEENFEEQRESVSYFIDCIEKYLDMTYTVYSTSADVIITCWFDN